MAARENIKSMYETYSGWGGVCRNGSTFGFDGYTKEEAEKVAQKVASNMAASSKVVTVLVSIERMGNGNYKVVNTSKYRSDVSNL